MKKNEIFTFTAPNGAEVTAVVVHTIFQGSAKQLDICYAQNRLFTLVEWEIAKDKGFKKELTYNGETIVDYCVLPEYDDMLEEYERNLVMEQASTFQNWEEEFEGEIQGCNDK